MSEGRLRFPQQRCGEPLLLLWRFAPPPSCPPAAAAAAASHPFKHSCAVRERTGFQLPPSHPAAHSDASPPRVLRPIPCCSSLHVVCRHASLLPAGSRRLSQGICSCLYGCSSGSVGSGSRVHTSQSTLIPLSISLGSAARERGEALSLFVQTQAS